MNLRRLIPALAAIVVCLSLSSAFGQTESATLSGLITDPQNRPVSGVQVVVTNQETGVSFRRSTNDAGVYVLVGLQPGRYRLSVTKEGFRRIDITDMTLAVQDVLSRNLQLQVGSVEASITVTGEASNINTTDATVSTYDRCHGQHGG